MKVQATKLGFVGGQKRYVDDVFEVDKTAYSDKWMKPIAPNPKKRKAGGASAPPAAPPDPDHE
jgi:hypothetical protein